MISIDPGEIIRQAIAHGVVLTSVTPKVFANSGIGIVATEDIDEGSSLISIPIEALRHEHNVSEQLRASVGGISVHGLLAIDMMLDTSLTRQAWKATLPTMESMVTSLPFFWQGKVQRLLPDAAAKLVQQQKDKLSRDWDLVSRAYPHLQRHDFEYFWFIVGTRTFYYTDPTSDEIKDTNECLALVPFADYFNHAPNGCRVIFSAEGYNFTARDKIRQGEEIFISYGLHSNDFLLAEYGFMLEDNEYDTVLLDSMLLPLFDNRRKELLESQNFWAEYHLDANGTCYRTDVAIRLLCMPQKLWLKTLEQGFDESDNFQQDVIDIKRKCLKKYLVHARKRLEQVAGLDPRFTAQKDMLRNRWEQILRLVLNALAAVAVGM